MVDARSAGDVVSLEEELAAILGDLRQKGMQLWVSNGELHYKAPKGAVTPETLAVLRTHKRQIASFMEKAARLEIDEPELLTRPPGSRAPLAFSQLAHWKEQKLAERRVMRGVSSAIRLRGRLDIDLFRKTIDAVVQRHEALRTRIVRDAESLFQEINATAWYDLTVYDLTQLPHSERQTEARRLIQKHTHQSVDVLVEPLFGAWLLRIAEDEHVLIVAMEHIISDGASRNILIRDIFSIYGQYIVGGPLTLPPIPLSFVDFAVWQQATWKSLLERHGSYWEKHLLGSPRVRFPTDISEPDRRKSGFGMIRMRFDGPLLRQLRNWCKNEQTTVTLGVLAMYVGFVCRWCNTS